MSRAIAKPKLIAAFLGGVRTAQHEYVKSTGGDWLWEAPEYLMCVAVMNKVCEVASKDGQLYVSLETSVSSCLKEAGAIQRGVTPKQLRRNGRFDVVVWYSKGKPRAAIEVKKQVLLYRQIELDVQRIVRLVKRNATSSTFQFGCVLFYSSVLSKKGLAREVLEGKIRNIYLETKARVPKICAGVRVSRQSLFEAPDANNAWAASCLTFEAI